MHKKIPAFISILLVVWGFCMSACSYHKKELEYPSGNVVPCDSSLVTYSNTIIPIFASNCYTCHSGAAIDGNGIKLDQYNIAKAYALFGNMLQVIKHEPGFVAMPKNAAKLSDCNIAKIRIWIEQGAPNN